MNELVRGLVLLASVLLWLPFLRPTVEGQLSIEEGLVRYLGALALAWAGGAGLYALVTSYAAASRENGSDAEPPALRRTDDVAS